MSIFERFGFKKPDAAAQDSLISLAEQSLKSFCAKAGLNPQLKLLSPPFNPTKAVMQVATDKNAPIEHNFKPVTQGIIIMYGFDPDTRSTIITVSESPAGHAPQVSIANQVATLRKYLDDLMVPEIEKMGISMGPVISQKL